MKVNLSLSIQFNRRQERKRERESKLRFSTFQDQDLLKERFRNHLIRDGLNILCSVVVVVAVIKGSRFSSVSFPLSFG